MLLALASSRKGQLLKSLQNHLYSRRVLKEQITFTRIVACQFGEGIRAWVESFTLPGIGPWRIDTSGPVLLAEFKNIVVYVGIGGTLKKCGNLGQIRQPVKIVIVTGAPG